MTATMRHSTPMRLMTLVQIQKLRREIVTVLKFREQFSMKIWNHQRGQRLHRLEKRVSRSPWEGG